MIISITAQKQSGKTTFLEYLCQEYGFTKLSHAKPLKDACCLLFNIDDPYTDEGKNTEISIPNKINYQKLLRASEIICGQPSPRLFLDKIYPHFANRTMTVREILQEMGTDVCRNIFGEDVWLDILNRSIDAVDGPVVIDDCRFLNESKNLRSRGAVMIGLQRPPLDLSDLHQSEIEMIENWDTMVDTTIVNSGSLENLYAMVEDVIESLLE